MLCFGFRRKTMLITLILALTEQSCMEPRTFQFLSFSYCPISEGIWGSTRNWEEIEPGQLNYPGQRDMWHHTKNKILEKLWGVGWRYSHCLEIGLKSVSRWWEIALCIICFVHSFKPVLVPAKIALATHWCFGCCLVIRACWNQARTGQSTQQGRSAAFRIWQQGSAEQACWVLSELLASPLPDLMNATSTS